MNDNTLESGFTHQKLIVIPKNIIDNITKNVISQCLYITDIGYYPNAENHSIQRSEGCQNHIVIYCIKGKGYIRIGKKLMTLKQNQLYIIPCSTPHKYWADKTEPWSIYWMHFSGTLANAYSSLSKNEVKDIPNPLQTEVISSFSDFIHTLSSGYTNDSFIHMSGLLAVFLSKIYTKSVQGNLNQSNMPDYINDVINYMQKHIQHRITLSQLCEVTNLSRNYLVSRFREDTGQTPMDYFIHLKVQKSCHFLDTTNLRVKEISFLMGYDDPYYFSRIFKRIMGQSPRQYRNSIKG